MSGNAIELSNEYRIITGEFKIKTPFVDDFSKVENIIIEQKDGFMRRLSIYPENFVVHFEQTPNEIIIRTNKPLRDNDDGTYDVIF